MGPPVVTSASRALARIDSAARGAPGLLRRLLGSAEQTMDDLLEKLLGDNFDRMGQTSQLPRDDVRALAAFLRTL